MTNENPNDMLQPEKMTEPTKLPTEDLSQWGKEKIDATDKKAFIDHRHALIVHHGAVDRS